MTGKKQPKKKQPVQLDRLFNDDEKDLLKASSSVRDFLSVEEVSGMGGVVPDMSIDDAVAHEMSKFQNTGAYGTATTNGTLIAVQRLGAIVKDKKTAGAKKRGEGKALKASERKAAIRKIAREYKQHHPSEKLIDIVWYVRTVIESGGVAEPGFRKHTDGVLLKMLENLDEIP